MQLIRHSDPLTVDGLGLHGLLGAVTLSLPVGASQANLDLCSALTLLGPSTLHAAMSTECSVARQPHNVRIIVCPDKMFTFVSIELTSDKQ